MVERTNRWLRQQIRTAKASQKVKFTHWTTRLLPQWLFDFNNTACRATGYTPKAVLFDSQLYDSLFQKRPQLKDKVHESAQRNRIEVGEDVLIRPPDELRDKNEPLEGPVRVV